MQDQYLTKQQWLTSVNQTTSSSSTYRTGTKFSYLFLQSKNRFRSWSPGKVPVVETPYNKGTHTSTHLFLLFPLSYCFVFQILLEEVRVCQIVFMCACKMSICVCVCVRMCVQGGCHCFVKTKATLSSETKSFHLKHLNRLLKCLFKCSHKVS